MKKRRNIIPHLNMLILNGNCTLKIQKPQNKIMFYELSFI